MLRPRDNNEEDGVRCGSDDNAKGGGDWSRKSGWEGICGDLDFMPPCAGTSGWRGGRQRG
jgi:hypothetical protein